MVRRCQEFYSSAGHFLHFLIIAVHHRIWLYLAVHPQIISNPSSNDSNAMQYYAMLPHFQHKQPSVVEGNVGNDQPLSQRS
jgi:hypothetical protein